MASGVLNESTHVVIMCACVLTASQDVAQYYQLYSADNFYYLNQSGCYTVDTIDDVKDYAEVLEAMNVLGFDQTEQGNVHGKAKQQQQHQHCCSSALISLHVGIVAAILHLGNVAFHDNGKGGADVSYPEVLQLAATYFQVDPSVLNKALTFRVLNTGGGGGGRRSTYTILLHSHCHCLIWLSLFLMSQLQCASES